MAATDRTTGPSSRPWRGRARLALAFVASLALHAALKRGLERATLDGRPSSGLLAPREAEYRPTPAGDFPLEHDPRRQEALAHERPLDIAPVAAPSPPGRRGKPEATVGPAPSPEPAGGPGIGPEPVERVAGTPEATAPQPVTLDRMPAGIPAAETAVEEIVLPAAVPGDDVVAPAPTRTRRRSSSAAPPPLAADRSDALERTVPAGVASTAPAAPGRPTTLVPVDALPVPPPLPDRSVLDAALEAGDPIGDPMGRTADAPEIDPPSGAAATGLAAASPGVDLPPVPRRSRGGARGASRGAGVAVGRDAAAGDGPAAEALSIVAVPVAAADRAANPARGDLPEAPVASPMPLSRSQPTPLPAETRVRETAAAFARRARQARQPTEADAIVDRGLVWLARTQFPDGHWTLGDHDPAGTGGKVRLRSDTAATGLALLAFLGAGHDHFDGPHRDTVRKGLEWLLSVQKDDGDLFLPADPVSNSCAWLYSHGIATTALCEAVGMTGDPLLRPRAARAIGFIAATQQPGRGGWRYLPRTDSDLSVTGWMVVALRAGTLAGVEVPAETLAGVATFLDAAALPDQPGGFVYNARDPGQRPSDRSGACMTALGTLARLHTGAALDDAGVVAAAARLAADRPSYGSARSRLRDAYLWYYASQVLVHTGGGGWDAWYRDLCTLLGSRQTVRGPDAGSWDPLGPLPDRWGAFGGRLYVTTLHLLALEVPYRHLPTYDIGVSAGE